MADEEVVRKKGRPVGSRTFKPEQMQPSKRMVDLMANAYSDAEWLRRYKRLPVSEQFRLRGVVEPKPKGEGGQKPNFHLTIEGLKPVCPRCGFSSPLSDGEPDEKGDL